MERAVRMISRSRLRGARRYGWPAVRHPYPSFDPTVIAPADVRALARSAAGGTLALIGVRVAAAGPVAACRVSCPDDEACVDGTCCPAVLPVDTSVARQIASASARVRPMGSSHRLIPRTFASVPARRPSWRRTEPALASAQMPRAAASFAVNRTSNVVGAASAATRNWAAVAADAASLEVNPRRPPAMYGCRIVHRRHMPRRRALLSRRILLRSWRLPGSVEQLRALFGRSVFPLDPGVIRIEGLPRSVLRGNPRIEIQG